MRVTVDDWIGRNYGYGHRAKQLRLRDLTELLNYPAVEKRNDSRATAKHKGYCKGPFLFKTYKKCRPTGRHFLYVLNKKGPISCACPIGKTS
jgi:hypothetical protein